MLHVLKQIFSGGRESSKSRAKSRLHFVLVQDRAGLSGDEMSRFKEELVSVIEKYFVIDKSAFDIDYKRDTQSTTLLINSPVVVRRQDSSDHAVGAKRKKEAKGDNPQVAPAA